MSSPKEKDAEFDVGNLDCDDLIVNLDGYIEWLIEDQCYSREQLIQFGWSKEYIERLEILYGLERFGGKTLLYTGRDLIEASKRQKAADLSKAETDALIRAYKKERSRDESIFKALEKLDV